MRNHLTQQIGTFGEIAEIERALLADDPAFVERVDRIRRRLAIGSTVIFALLTASATLLAIGLATTSLAEVDERGNRLHRRRPRRIVACRRVRRSSLTMPNC